MQKRECDPKYVLPIPTIDELRLFIGRGAVRLPPPHDGISCVRRCGVRGTSHLQLTKKKHKSYIDDPKENIAPNGGCTIKLIAYPLAKMGVSGRLHDV